MRWTFCAIVLVASAAMAADLPTTSPTPDNPDLAALVGKTAPAIELPGLDGKTYSLSQYAGNVVVLDFWGTFCIPCKRAMPHLQTLEKELGGHGLTALTIAEGATAADAKKFVTDIGVTLPVLLDANLTVGNAYAVQALPETVVIGRDGKIRDVFDKGDDPTEAAIDAAVRSAVGDDSPATRPAASGDAATVQSILAEVGEAYRAVKTLQVAGTIHAQADIDGQKLSHQADFTGVLDGPGRFRHEVVGDVVIAADAGKLYVYLPKESLYFSGDAPGSRGILDDLGAGAAPVLRAQDLSLALTLSDDPARDLVAGAKDVAMGPEIRIGAMECPALEMTLPAYRMTVAIDPQTHLVRRVILDSSASLTARGANVKTALTTVDFTRTITDKAPTADQLAFALPPTASEDQPEAADADSLTGKPAPPFKLTGVDGTVVSSGSLKGSVYILDFWATWCGPCRMSLPGLDAIYKAKKADGLKVFAVDEMEDRQTVQQFVAESGLTIPVLLDSDNAAGAAYGAEAIPETVLVGRDGVVRQVFIGAGHEEEISAAVDAALGK